MKNSLLFLVFVTSLSIFGQNGSMGFKGGFNFSTLVGDNTNEVEGRTAFHVGLMVEVPITDRIFIQPELLYSSKGFKGDFDGSNLDNRFNYLDFPLLFKYFLTDEFNVVIGPQGSLLLSAVSSSDSRKDETINGIKGVDFGLNLGFGFKFKSNFAFDVRFSPGLSNINDRDNFDDINKNSTFLLSVGYFLK